MHLHEEKKKKTQPFFPQVNASKREWQFTCHTHLFRDEENTMQLKKTTVSSLNAQFQARQPASSYCFKQVWRIQVNYENWNLKTSFMLVLKVWMWKLVVPSCHDQQQVATSFSQVHAFVFAAFSCNCLSPDHRPSLFFSEILWSAETFYFWVHLGLPGPVLKITNLSKQTNLVLHAKIILSKLDSACDQWAPSVHTQTLKESSGCLFVGEVHSSRISWHGLRRSCTCVHEFIFTLNVCMEIISDNIKSTAPTVS